MVGSQMGLLAINGMFPDLLEFGEQLQIKLNKNSQILKNNQNVNPKFDF